MRTESDIHDQLRPFLSFKVLEFVEMGYETISTMDLARYLVRYRWKKVIPENPLEQMYQVLHLNINDYFDYESIEAQTSKTDTLDTIDLSDLLS